MIRKWLRNWLGIQTHREELDELQKCVKILDEAIYQLKKQFKDLKNSAIVGVDLGFKEDSQIIIIQYNKAAGGIKVIASDNFTDPEYQKLIRGLRQYMVKYNAEFLVVDAPPLQARIIEGRVWNGLDQAFNISQKPKANTHSE